MIAYPREARPSRRAGDLPHEDRAAGRRRVARDGDVGRRRGHGHEQRASRAALSKGGRAAGRSARRDLDHVAARQAPRLRLGFADGGRRLERSARALAAARGHELHASRGARRPPVAVSRRDRTRERSSSTRDSGTTIRPSADASRRSPSSITKVRSSSRTTSIRSCSPPAVGSSRTTPACRRGGYHSPLHRGESLDMSPEDAERLGVERGDMVRVTSRRGTLEAPVLHRPRSARWRRVHDAAFPRRRRDEPAHDQRDRLRSPAPPSSRRARCASNRCARDRCAPRAAPSRSPPPGTTDGFAAAALRPDRRRACRGRRTARTADVRVGRRRARRPLRRARRARRTGGCANNDICCCPRCRRCSRASAGSARRGSSTSASGSNVPPADAWGVATFYALLSTTPRPRRVLHVCDDIACRCKGAAELIDQIEASVGPAHAHGPNGDHVHVDDAATVWMRSPCLGQCDFAPAALLQEAGPLPREEVIRDLSLDEARTILRGGEPSREPKPRRSRAMRLESQWTEPMTETQTLRLPQDSNTTTPSASLGHVDRLLRRIGTVDPTDIAAYTTSGGFDALRRALEIGPDAVIREVIDSKLMGRGGAAFPTGRKWDAVAKQSARPHYLICNADESEPGTFKDRVLLDGDPFAIVEAMTIAGFATGCERGFLYIRGEYPLGAERIAARDRPSRARTASSATTSSAAAFGSTSRFGAAPARTSAAKRRRSSIRSKAIAASRATSRRFPAQAGLFGLPTVVNNVETLANVPSIVLNGGAAFARIGTEQSTGTKLFCVSGNVERAGRLRGAVRHDAARSARHWRAASPTADRSRRSCSAARRACSCGPTSWTCRSRSRARAPPRRRSARASSSRSTTRST